MAVIRLHIILNILLDDGLSQDIEYHSLCYTVGPCYSSILHIIVCIASSKLPVHPSSSPSLSATTSLFLHVCESKTMLIGI